jgi:hypothetical protein
MRSARSAAATCWPGAATWRSGAIRRGSCSVACLRRASQSRDPPHAAVTTYCAAPTLCALHLVDLQERRGVRHLRVHGKGATIRYVPLHPAAAGAIAAYLEVICHCDDKAVPLFQPVSNNTWGANKSITPDGACRILAPNFRSW